MYCCIVVLCLLAAAQADYKNPNTAGGRSAMVHLFEWPWRSIARECEDFLGPNGFGGVQVSPPNEHRIIDRPDWDNNVVRPWYESYQPISYKLESRRGNRAEFIDMVQRCNNAGVRIYVDAVVNHMCGEDAMTGVGSGSSPYETQTFNFYGVPYTSPNFNVPNGNCGTGSGKIENYGDVNQVRNCNLVGLMDLITGDDYVRGKIVDYFNDVIDIGVAGFRVDAAKHMWPEDCQAIFDGTNNLNTAYFPENSRALFYQEVIDKGGEPVTAGQYKDFGRVTDFIYGGTVSAAFGGRMSLNDLQNFGSGNGAHHNLYDNDALVFVDNHDNQRGHGGGGSLLTFNQADDYKLAIAFMLSWPHGFPRIMSSYKFDQDWTGPPADNDWNTVEPTFNADGSCVSTDSYGWVCEHRWRGIKNMVEWRNQAGTEPVQNFWGDYSRLAFSRGNRAFIAIGRGGSSINEQLQTGLPSGEYCNMAVVDYDSSAKSCTGHSTVIVDSSGYADISISGNGADNLLFIHVGASKDGPIVAPTSDPNEPTLVPTQGPTGGPQPTSPAGWERTVIFIYKPTSNGQDVFVRGGIDHSKRSGCSNNADSNNNCAMPITHRIGGGNSKFNDWKSGDDFLDWYGAESDQGKNQGQSAEGTPLVWTTNDAGYQHKVDTDGYGYTSLNVWGEHYWMLDINMDCSKTEEGWFELKGILKSGGAEWESDRNQGSCSGSAGGSAPYSTGNHFARCGYLNKFSFNSNDCQIENL
eukprot:XP_011682124.1 PREDICTED: alpha-amylase 4N isoform X1 [Strongylocentrotus purpuratus]